MKQKYLTIFGNVAALAALILAWSFSNRTYRLESELEASRQANAMMEEQLASYGTSLHIDSLLAQGDFHKALQQQAQFAEGIEGAQASGIQLRMAVIADLLQQRDALQAALESRAKDDSTTVVVTPGTSASTLREMDSLNFALEKAQLELSGLRRRLKEKSYGEYLTFKNEKGTLVYYVGQVKNGKAHGYGIALMETGSRYEGEWKNNQRHGQGSFYWEDGQYYVGEYRNDRRNGNGAYFWPNGEKYVGDWKNDRRSGEGKFYDGGDQLVAQGTWKGDKLVEER